MKPSSIFASALLFASSALGAPAATRTFPRDAIQNGTNTGGASSATQTLFPDLQVRWSSKSTNPQSLSSKVGHLLNSESEKVITAVNFIIPNSNPYAGKTCKLVFRLSIDDGIVTSSAAVQPQFDVYRIPVCLNIGYNYHNRPPRGAYAGTVTAKKGKWDDKVPAAASWPYVDNHDDKTEPIMASMPEFDCQPGEYVFEMVAKPYVNMNWTSGRGSGLSIEVSG